MKITVSSKEFSTFIAAISNVTRQGVTLKIHKNYIEVITLSDDNCSIIVYAKMLIINSDEIKLGDDEVNEVHIKDIQKFKKLIDMNGQETFTFEIKNNYIYFKSKKVKGAKFMLAESSFRPIKKQLTAEWFNSFEKNLSTTVTKSDIKEILAASSFVSDSVGKIYFYEKDGEIVAEINDNELANVDSMIISLSDNFKGTITDKVIINITTLGQIYLACDDILIESATIGAGVNSSEVLFITENVDNVAIKYLLNTLKS